MLVRLSIEKQKKFQNECYDLHMYGLVKIFLFYFILNNNFFLCLNLIPSCISFYFAFASSTEHCCPICTKLCNIHQHNIVINLYKKKFPSGDIYNICDEKFGSLLFLIFSFIVRYIYVFFLIFC